MSLQKELAKLAAQLTVASVQIGLLETEVETLKAAVVLQLAEIERLHDEISTLEKV